MGLRGELGERREGAAAPRHQRQRVRPPPRRGARRPPSTGPPALLDASWLHRRILATKLSGDVARLATSIASIDHTLYDCVLW